MEEGCNSAVVVVIAALQEVEMEEGCSSTSSSYSGDSSTIKRWRWRRV